MLVIGERTSAGYPISISNDGVFINVQARDPKQVLEAVAHFYAVPHAVANCPLCDWKRKREVSELAGEYDAWALDSRRG